MDHWSIIFLENEQIDKELKVSNANYHLQFIELMFFEAKDMVFEFYFKAKDYVRSQK